MKTQKLFGLLTIALFLLAACQREGANTRLKVHLTDAPATYDEVNIDLQQVQVQMAADTTGWQTLQTRAGMYDLLQLQNGVDTLVAEGTIAEGTVHQLRLILGDDNNIVLDGETYPLTIPSGSESGLKVKLHKKMNKSLEDLIVDFDAGLAVHQDGQGN